MMAPASMSRCTAVAVNGATKSSNIFDPQVQRIPATVIRSFTAMGRPSRAGKSTDLLARALTYSASASSACLNARSGSSVMNACKVGSSSSMRCKCAASNSRAEKSPLRRPAII